MAFIDPPYCFYSLFPSVLDIAILNRRSEVEIGRIDRENERKLKAKHYFINKNVYSSIFNLPGLECVKYTHKIIDLKLKPIKFRFVVNFRYLIPTVISDIL